MAEKTLQDQAPRKVERSLCKGARVKASRPITRKRSLTIRQEPTSIEEVHHDSCK